VNRCTDGDLCFLTGPIYFLREVNLVVKESTLSIKVKVVLISRGQYDRCRLAYDAVYCDRRLETRHGKLLPSIILMVEAADGDVRSFGLVRS